MTDSNDPEGAPVADPSLGALVADEAPVAEEAPAPVAEEAPALVAEEAPAPPPAAAPAPAALPPMAPPPMAPPVPVVVAAPAPVVIQQVAPARPRRGVLYLIRRVVAFLFGVLQALLIIRILLEFFNANPDDSIVNSVMTITQPFVDPFLGMFNLDAVEGANGSVVDIAAIVALVAWTLIETLVLSVLRLFDRRGR